jgi:hypothetical protein
MIYDHPDSKVKANEKASIGIDCLKADVSKLMDQKARKGQPT